MLTLHNIKELSLEKAKGGYNKVSVEEFVGQVIELVSKLEEDKKDLQNKIVFLAEKIDSITFEGKKYLVTYSAKVSKNTAKVNSDLKIELISNSEKKLLSVVSYVAELKTNGVMVENPTKGEESL